MQIENNNIFHINKKPSGQINWTEEQENKIVELYNNGFSLTKICKLFDIKAPQTIRNLLKRKGIKIIGFRHAYPVNEEYFSVIDSAEKAYWLGMLYADGSVTSKNQLWLGLKDKEHIEKFKNSIGAFNHKIGVTIDNRYDEPKIQYHISIKSKKLCDDLIEKGCIKNKSLLLEKIPDIEKEYISHFIRGYFDGDGSINCSIFKSKKKYRISFVGTYSFLQNIQKELGFFTKICKNSPAKNNSFYFQVNGNIQLVKFFNYIYKNSTKNIVLKRKYEKYLEFCSDLGASPLNLDI